ncbi:MAG TPA: tetratricopeptide repeat protein [Phenylobacterium sp.]|jgi:tetratricopeptide (TPR) repeat protein
MQRWVFCAAAIAALSLGTAARAAVTVIGGGQAEACSKAARAGKSDIVSERLCTEAIETELLSARDRAGTYVNRGVLKLRRLSFEAAIRDFDAAVGLEPRMGEAYINRGAASIGEHRFAESLPDLNKAIALGVEEPAKAYYNRALAYEGLDDVKSAYFDYQKAVELSPAWQAPKDELVRFHISSK